MIFYTAVKILLTPVSSASKVRRSHWVPYCFVRRFDESFSPEPSFGGKRNSRQAVCVTKTSFNGKGEMVDSIVKDNTFIHPPNHGISFYHPSLESFFNVWETAYSELMQKVERGVFIETALDVISAYVFGITLEVRKRNKNRSFSVSNISELIEDLLMRNTSSSTSYVSVVTDVDNRNFTTFVGSEDMSEIFNKPVSVFLISPEMSVVVTENTIDDNTAHNYAEIHQQSLVEKMRNGVFELYGLPFNKMFWNMWRAI